MIRNLLTFYTLLWLFGLLSVLVIETNGQREVPGFQSPNYPNSYPVRTGDTFEVSSSDSEQLTFIFTYLYLHAKDTVEFATGSKYLTGTFLGCMNSYHATFKGTKLGYAFIGLSTGDSRGKACAISSYTLAGSGDNKTANAWQVKAYAYQRCPPPSAPFVLTAPDFYLASPLYPDNYPTGRECKWTVQPASDPAQRIRVVIDTLVLAPGDYLELSHVNGEAIHVNSVGTYLSDSNQLSLRFLSASTSSSRGYHLYYRLVGCKSSEIKQCENCHVNNPASFYDDSYELQFECDSGWKFASGLLHEYSVCQGSSWTWRDATPPSSCARVTCAQFPLPENGDVTFSDDCNAGSVASFSCASGFQLVGDRTLTCGVDGSWDTEVLPQCVNSSEIACGPLIPPANGDWQCLTALQSEREHCTSHESEQELVCVQGYYVDGVGNVTKCNFTVWTNLPLFCSLRCCSNLSDAIAMEPQLGYHSDGLCYEDSLEFFCDTGYHLVGQATRLCGADGLWLPTEQVPSCRVTDCGPPPIPNEVTTTVSFNDTLYNAEAHYSCVDSEKYELAGPATLTCLEDGQWSSTQAASCVKKQCYIADLHLLVPGATVQPVQAHYYVDDNITVSCSNTSANVTCSPAGWQNVNLTGPCSSSLRYLGNLRSPKYPNAYNLEPQSINNVTQAFENERIIYVVNEVSLNLRDTLTFSTVTSTPDARQPQCSGSGSDSGHWVKQFEGQSQFNYAADVVFTPFNQSCTSFSVVQKPQPGTGRRGFDIDVYAMHVCPAAQDGYTITEAAFYIASPNFPYVFPVGDICTWFIAPTQCNTGQRLALNIEYVRTKRGESQACLHQLSVGPVNDVPLTLCGYHDNVPVLIDACTAFVSFDARASIQLSDQGFFLSYRTVGCATKNLPTKGKAKLVNPSNYYQSGYLATFECDQGSHFSSGAQLEYALCQGSDSDSGTWKPIGPDTTCIRRTCDTKVTVLNGKTSMMGDGSSGSLLYVTCEEGYKLVGEPFLTCTESGVWSAPVPSCVSDTDGRCSQPSILHGRLLCQVGDTDDQSHLCTLQCDTGYYASYHGNVTCNQGLLTPSNLTCLPVRCGELSQNDVNLAWAQLDDTAGTAVEFYCKTGYCLDGPDTTFCSSEGRWSYLQAGEPKCVAVVCDAPPEGVRLEVLYYQEPTYNMQATYSCARAYQLVGTSQLVCGALGNWDGTLPYCVPKTCYTSEIVDVVPEAVVLPSGAVAVSQTANVTCGGTSVQVLCTESGWNLDALYVAGCLIRPSPTPNSLKEVSNVTFEYSTVNVNVTEAYVTAKTFSASNKKNRIVFVTHYANLKEGDSLSYHMGASSAPVQAGASSSSTSTSATATAGEQWRCSASAAQLLRTYTGGFSREFDIVYATETACAQLKLEPSNKRTESVGFSLQAFETEACPSPLLPATFTETQFMLASPHYPRSYSALESCFWYIKPWPCGKGQALQVLVTFADIPAPHELRFTLANSSQVHISGSVENRQFLTLGCDVSVYFDTSGNAEPGKGFEFTYKVTGCNELAIPVANHSYIVNPQDFYPAGYVVQLQCELGTQFESGVSVEAVVCTVDNSWQPTGTLSKCVPILCPTLPSITNGQSVPPTPLLDASYGINVTFSCDPGYVLVGDKLVTCNGNGDWSNSPPVCALPSDVYHCSQPVSSHADFTCSRTPRDSGTECTAHDAVQQAACVVGYELTTTSSTIACRNATWVPEPESLCKRKCCGNISELATTTNGTSPADIDLVTGQCYQDTVVFTCPVGYNMSGPAQAVCTADATWSTHVPTCHLVQCGVIESGGGDGGLHATVNGSTYGSYVWYHCDLGYQLSGESYRLCQADGTWSGSEPACLPNECLSQDLKMVVAGLTIWDEVPVYYFGESALVTCGGGGANVNVSCGAQGWETEPLYSAGCLTTSPVPTTPPITSTTLQIVTTLRPITFDVPRFVTNATSPNYPNQYPVESSAAAATVSNGGFLDERVVFFVKVANLRAGDSLKLFSKASASTSACSDSNALKQYTGSVDESGNSYGGKESDYVVTSTSSACYLFETSAQPSTLNAQPIGYFMDIYSLADCPSEDSNYTLKASSFALASPNYPNAYPVKKLCRWNIAPACSSQRLQLHFDAFDVACGHYLQLHDANTSDSFCGSNKPPSTIVTQSCTASLIFDTKAPSNPTKGFRLSYSVVGCSQDQLPTREHAAYSPLDFYDAGTQVNYTCATGMLFASGKQVERVLCSVSYQWQFLDDPTGCTPITCHTLPAPENGKVTVLAAEYEGQAVFSCNEAFELVGNSVLTCTENGSWSGTPPICRPINYQSCATPDLVNSELKCVSNCSTVDGAYVHGAVLHATCKLGFESTPLSRTTSCTNGTWTPTLSDCTRVCCTAYNLVENEENEGSRLQPSVFATGSCFNDTVAFSCPKAYNLVGSTQAVCGADKQWTPATVPYCEAVKCDELELTQTPNLQVESTCETVTYGCSVLFSCSSGYNLVGRQLAECDERGQWENVPKCNVNTCALSDLQAQLPPGAKLDDHSGLVTNVEYGKSVTVSCLSKKVEVKCGEQSWESGSLCSLVCVPNYCSTEQLVEVAATVGATASFPSNVGSTVEEGYSVALYCASYNVDTAICDAVTWKTKPLEEVRTSCDKLKPTTTTTTTTTTATSTSTSISSSATRSSSQTAAPNSSTQKEPEIAEEEPSSDSVLVIALAVICGVLAVTLVLLLLYIYKGKSKSPIPRQRYTTNNSSSINNPVFHDLEDLASGNQYSDNRSQSTNTASTTVSRKYSTLNNEPDL